VNICAATFTGGLAVGGNFVIKSITPRTTQTSLISNRTSVPQLMKKEVVASETEAPVTSHANAHQKKSLTVYVPSNRTSNSSAHARISSQSTTLKKQERRYEFCKSYSAVASQKEKVTITPLEQNAKRFSDISYHTAFECLLLFRICVVGYD
jgi:hypothetical protein